jgi:hypothetical protein
LLAALESHSADHLAKLRSIAILERIGTPAAKKLLQTLAGRFPEARLTNEAQASLKRINRREMRAKRANVDQEREQK